jgi:hypothetical protein
LSVGLLTPRKKAPKGSNKPPTEEERAALRLKKEQEKLAKAQAKLAADNPTPGEVQARSAEAATVVPKVPNGGPSSAAVVQTQMPKLKLVAKGKVRDIYELPGEPDKLLFVATDRISAFDVIMENVSWILPAGTLRARTLPDLALTPSPGHSAERHHPDHAVVLLVLEASTHHSQPRSGPLGAAILVHPPCRPYRPRIVVERVPTQPRRVPRPARGTEHDREEVRGRQG